MIIERFDLTFIRFCRRLSVPFARLGLFVIFFWFGALKVLGLSPATPLVEHLFEQTVPFMTFSLFIVLFGLFECLIGLLFLFRGVERVVIPMLAFHMVTTLMPLFLLAEETWSGFMVPTLEGQYIIKNLALIAAAIVIVAHMHPMNAKR
ncbi:MAG: hypothetical protein EXS46_02975 [Candidatus Taylorbacteria bacterium]|nr:hypothetical protein [Candidatus Taylorbacteria bacterium]